MKTWTTTLLAAAATLALASAAAAQDVPLKEPAEPAAPEDSAQVESDFSVSFNVGASTDYVFRGISQTDEEPQLFAGADLSGPNGFYAGVWGSNVDFSFFGDDETDVEVDFYAGVKPVIGNTTLDFGVIYYTYWGQPDDIAELNYVEFKAAASHAIGPATVGAAVFYSPEFTGETDEAVYYEVNGAYTATDRLSFSAALGHQDVSFDGDYTTWNVGGTFLITPNIGLDLRYHGTDADDFGDLYDDRVVALVKASF